MSYFKRRTYYVENYPSYKQNKSGRSSFANSFVTTRADQWEGTKSAVVCYAGCPSIPLTGKEYDKAYYWFHGDNGVTWGNSKFSRQQSHAIARMNNKKELWLYENNPEYEVMPQFPHCLSWER
jgi:hypothetical protein